MHFKTERESFPDGLYHEGTTCTRARLAVKVYYSDSVFTLMPSRSRPTPLWVSVPFQKTESFAH